MCESICLKDCLCVGVCVCVCVFGSPPYTLENMFTKSIPLRNLIQKAFRVTLAVKVEIGGTVWPDGSESDCDGRTSLSATFRMSADCLIQSVNPKTHKQCA